jgi:hypothetical protein
MDKIAKTCIKNTKRIRKKIQEAKLCNIDVSNNIALSFYSASIEGVLNPEMTLNLPPEVQVDQFISNYPKSQNLIEKCSELYGSPSLALMHLYSLSKKALISLRNEIRARK